MESTLASAASTSTSAAIAGPSSEVSTPAAYDEDARHGGSGPHFAITASQVPKPAASMPSLGPSTNMSSPELAVKDMKSLAPSGPSSGTRFLEDCHVETDSTLPSPRLRSSRMFKGKGKEAVPIEKEKKKPLRLLDLPVDILKDIVKEVTHTNDLTSLALCHSALHSLTIPHIYSRFDIVWPDSSTHAEPRSGVDALTYGLATLVMAEEIFGEAPNQRREAYNGNRFNVGGIGQATDTTVRRRRGNHYAQFTRKFSLGNGPADWVQEYLITKEGGKMLGTLVALAVARMRALETFIWDMPTGILRDVWLALSSLGDRYDGKPCRLEKVWVRWHDNSSPDTTNPIPPPPPPINIAAVPPPPLQTSSLNAGLPQSIHPAALDRVEHPSFSVLPPLKSLSVLDIDELAYLDEMAVLIGKSIDKLRELRVGIARHAMTRDWVTVWEGETVQQVDPDYPTAGSLTIGEKRLGGVLGTLTGFICDMRKPRIILPERIRHRRHSSRATATSPPAEMPAPVDNNTPPLEPAPLATTGLTSLRDVMAELPADEPESSLAFPPSSPVTGETALSDGPLPAFNVDAAVASVLPEVLAEEPADEEKVVPVDFLADEPPKLEKKLALESLELERVPLSVPVLQKGIDWTRLTSLTLLHCPNHEQLWKTLRRTFAPTAKSPTYPTPRRTSTNTSRKSLKAALSASDVELEYPLSLKKVHTNTVSPALISFLKETLPPNSLEVLFLQEARSYSSSVTVEAIFKGPLRRHRNSLKKILIDSSEKGQDGLPTNSSRWRRWMLTREILTFICSGKMPALKELGFAVDYRDWHFFLQHIPSIPHLRSLYLPFLADHVSGPNVEPRELALQIVDIVALRPEVELCYMGIANKCFEILENRSDDNRNESHLGVIPGGHNAGDVAGSDDGEDEDDDVDDVDDEDDEEYEEDDTESEDDIDLDDEDSDDEDTDASRSKAAARLRLREILFYDDKVAVFKARHGRL
ncbi:hypothetical protein PRZ48_011952 [Zasmidium cellare]|uniref:F-box domain-containing protein n=1 Tax=Zasmidium cellare TaxID=395010 RepID=A0ABR0E8F6_ZASCE|nr:hypothetical protein PRZ48_011952 [Zasmidium cellare]